MKAQKLENVEWKNIIYIKFKAGKAGEASELEGGPEKAQELWARYQSLVLEAKNEVAYVQK